MPALPQGFVFEVAAIPGDTQRRPPAGTVAMPVVRTLSGRMSSQIIKDERKWTWAVRAANSSCRQA
jgi:hypothetical protein